MRSFPQARDITELLLAVTPSAISELRDRGLLAYHLNDLTGALRDLQTYLKLAGMGEVDEDAREEHQQIWEHVKTLRRLSCVTQLNCNLYPQSIHSAVSPWASSKALSSAEIHTVDSSDSSRHERRD